MKNIKCFMMQENVEGQYKGNEVSNIVTHKSQIIKTCNFYIKNSSEEDDDDDEGEAIDMDAFVESGLLEDDSVTFSPSIFTNVFF